MFVVKGVEGRVSSSGAMSIGPARTWYLNIEFPREVARTFFSYPFIVAVKGENEVG